MAWQDRLREAAYNSPGGTRRTFHYEDVSRKTPKRTTAFQFPQVDGAYIQDNGLGPRSYPLRVFFWGDNHDIEATSFELMLFERGVGKLEHPFYGTFDVVPFGDISRRDDLKSAANQTVIEITFMTTLGVVYPSAGVNPKNEIQAALDASKLASAEQYADQMDVSQAVLRASSGAGIKNMLLSTSAALNSVSRATLAVTREFRESESTINLGIDVLVGQPLQIAGLIANLVTLPGRALAGIRDRLVAYGILADDIYGDDLGNPAQTLINQTFLPLRTSDISNGFLNSNLFSINAVNGKIVSVLNHEFSTKPEAIEAAENILTALDDHIAWRDEGFEALKTIPDLAIAQIDTGESIQALQEVAALTAGFLVEVSFSLTPERRIVLDRPRTIVDLAGELYGSIDDRLDFMISTNNLTGSEILELPRGTSVVYYS